MRGRRTGRSEEPLRRAETRGAKPGGGKNRLQNKNAREDYSRAASDYTSTTPAYHACQAFSSRRANRRCLCGSERVLPANHSRERFFPRAQPGFGRFGVFGHHRGDAFANEQRPSCVGHPTKLPIHSGTREKSHCLFSRFFGTLRPSSGVGLPNNLPLRRAH